MGVVAAAIAVPVLVGATWPATATTDVAGRPVRVMTFNIEQGLTLGQLQLEQLAQHIELADPDVIVLGGVSDGDGRSPASTDGAAWFSRRLRMPFGWSPAADNQFGNVILNNRPTDHRARGARVGEGQRHQDRSARWRSSTSMPGARTCS